MDFEDPRRDIDRIVRGQNDYIFIQVESLTRGFNKVGWQCRNPDYCPVVEVARMQFEDDLFGIMLKIDDDAVLYENNGLEYLQIMFAEVFDASEVPLDADYGIFFSFEITNIEPVSCPDYTDPYLIYNIEGGGGIRNDLVTDDYDTYQAELADECYALSDPTSPLPVNYRTIDFDESVWEDYSQ